MIKKLKIWGLVSIGVVFLAEALQGQRYSEDIIIRDATVLTVTQGVQEESDIWIKDGKIHDIGIDLKVPEETRSIDAVGKYVMPGIIDAHSHLGIDAINEATNPVTSEVFTGDAIDPFDIGIYRALAGGVTISHAMHGSANAIGGQCETIKHRWGEYDPEALRMEGAMRTIKFALGENPLRVHGEGNNIQPSTRMGIEQVFRRSFSTAQEYTKKWDEYRANPVGAPPEYDLRLETIAEILSGEIMIHCHSYRADEILMLMNVCKDYGIEKICFQHVNEGFKVAPELAEFGAYASIFADWWAYKFEVYYSTAYNAKILMDNGVLTSINSDDRQLIRQLYHEAAKSQRYGGLSDEDALRLITINPATQLGIEDRVGSLEKGKDGDLVIFDAHPLSIYAIPEMTIIEGKVLFDRKENPDDMRLKVDPSESYHHTQYNEDCNHEHRCMQGVQELGLFLFHQH